MAQRHINRQPPPGGVFGCVIRLICASATYWAWTSQLRTLCIWHVSLYDSGWLAVLLFSGHLMAVYPLWSGLLLTLGSSVVIEIARKNVEEFLPVPDCFTTTTFFEPERGVGGNNQDGVVLVQVGAIQEWILRLVRFLIIYGTSTIVERNVVWEVWLPPATAGAVLCLVFLDLFLMAYLPVARAWQLYPIEIIAVPSALEGLGLEQISREQIRKEETCPISLEPIIHPCRPLACSHIFEQSHIVQSVQLNSLQNLQMYANCPVCRALILPRGELDQTHIVAQRELCLKRHGHSATTLAAPAEEDQSSATGENQSSAAKEDQPS